MLFRSARGNRGVQLEPLISRSTLQDSSSSPRPSLSLTRRTATNTWQRRGAAHLGLARRHGDVRRWLRGSLGLRWRRHGRRRGEDTAAARRCSAGSPTTATAFLQTRHATTMSGRLALARGSTRNKNGMKWCCVPSSTSGWIWLGSRASSSSSTALEPS